MDKTNFFLTDSECLELKIRHRKEKNRRNADRIKAVLLANKGWTYKQIADALLLDEDTISRHIKEYCHENKLKNRVAPGAECKLSSEQGLMLISHLEKNIYLKVLQICDYVKNTFNIKYTVAGMTNWLRRNDFTYRKPHAYPAKADLEKQEEFKKEYKKLKKETPENEPILFLDAVHPTMATKVVCGWIRKKSEKAIETIASRTRMNIVGAINLSKMQVDIKDYKTVNSDSMIDFFKFLKICYPDAPKIHTILDQGAYHTSKATKDYAKANDIVLHYLPSYSPNLNPIERLWKVMNEHVRNNNFFDCAKKFKKSIRNFFEKIWENIKHDMKKRINDNFQKLPIPAISS